MDDPTGVNRRSQGDQVRAGEDTELCKAWCIRDRARTHVSRVIFDAHPKPGMARHPFRTPVPIYHLGRKLIPQRNYRASLNLQGIVNRFQRERLLLAISPAAFEDAQACPTC